MFSDENERLKFVVIPFDDRKNEQYYQAVSDSRKWFETKIDPIMLDTLAEHGMTYGHLKKTFDLGQVILDVDPDVLALSSIHSK